MNPSRPSRPLVGEWFLGARLVLVATLPVGVLAYYRNSRIGVTTWEPGSRMGVNFRTFRYAAERALAGEPFYNEPPPGTFDWATYLYPPGTVPVFYPFTALEWTTGYAVLTGLSVLAAGVATWLLVEYVESFGPRLGWLDVALLFAAFVFSTHAFGTVYFGNINLLLALAFVLGFWALRNGHEGLAGGAFGLAALFKLFPAIVGVWLLWRRRWRAVGSAVLVGSVGLALGVVLYGVETTRYYLTEVVAGRTETDLFVGGYPIDGTFYLTVKQPLSHLLWTVWPGAPYGALLGLSVLVCVSVLAYFYRNVHTVKDRQMAILVTLIVMVTVVPSLRWYLVLLYPPLVTLLYVWTDGPGRRLFLVGGLLVSVPASPGDTVEYLSLLPDPLATVLVPLGEIAVIPLYGLGLLVLGCGWYQYRT